MLNNRKRIGILTGGGDCPGINAVIRAVARKAILGLGAEIAARVGEEALTSLLAPIERVTGFDTAMPLSQLEHYYLPDHRRVLAGARKVFRYQK